MKALLRIAFAAVLALAASAAPALAQEAPGRSAPTAPFAPDREGLARIEAYLNGITTLKADFLQVASTGEVARGIFYLRRPGRLRVEYEPAVPMLIVADGHRLIYHDKELDHVSMVPIERTLAAFLARPEIRFGDDVMVRGYARDGGLVRVTLVQRRDPDAGSLMLIFDDSPLMLRQWVITDAQGVETRVALQDTRWGLALDSALFDIPEPERRRFP